MIFYVVLEKREAAVFGQYHESHRPLWGKAQKLKPFLMCIISRGPIEDLLANNYHVFIGYFLCTADN